MSRITFFQAKYIFSESEKPTELDSPRPRYIWDTFAEMIRPSMGLYVGQNRLITDPCMGQDKVIELYQEKQLF